MTAGELIERLLSALKEAPETEAHLDAAKPGVSGWRADAMVSAQIGGRPITFVVEVKRSAFPRDAREAVWQLRNLSSHQTTHDERKFVPMLIAESISPGAREFLRQEHVAYYDSGGSLYVPVRGAFIFVDKPLPKMGNRAVRSLFTDRRAQILHAVWDQEDAWFGVDDIARRSGVSPGTVSATLMAMEQWDWVSHRGVGPNKERRLVDRRGLLDTWTDYQIASRPSPFGRYFIPAARIEDLIRKLSHACEENEIPYAITGEAAAQAYAPYLSTVSQLRCRLPTGSDLEALLRSLDARNVVDGWNLGVVDTKMGTFSFRRRLGDAWYADPLQTYLDLLQAGGRASEMAQHLRREILGA